MSERARCSFIVHCLLHAVVLLGRGNLRAAERWLGDAQRMVDAAPGMLTVQPGPRETGAADVLPGVIRRGGLWDGGSASGALPSSTR